MEHRAIQCQIFSFVKLIWGILDRVTSSAAAEELNERGPSSALYEWWEGALKITSGSVAILCFKEKKNSS